LNNTPGQTISQSTRERVLAEAARLGYRPHTAARALAGGRSRIVLLVLPDWPLDFNLRRNLEEASLALDEAGYALVSYTPHPTGQALPLWELLDPDVVVGLRPFTADQVAAMRSAGVTCILPDPDQPDVAEYPEDGPVLQVAHPAELGHSKIAYAGSADARVADLVQLRLPRAQQAADERGLGVLPTLDLGLTDDSARSAVRGWIDDGVTAVAAYNDDVAAAIVGAATRLGLTLPADLSIIGHDDTPAGLHVASATDHCPRRRAGRGRYMAAEALSLVEDLPAPDAGPEFSVTLSRRASTRSYVPHPRPRMRPTSRVS
jgi:DNA-binding LacI/PurR family transcriptional regulator